MRSRFPRSLFVSALLQSNVRTLVEGLMTTYSKMAGAKVSVSCVVADAVPLFVQLDPLRVAQVLANGITNALKQTTVGVVGLHVSVAALEGKRFLLFQVLDTGPGLRGVSYKQLFDPTGDAGNWDGHALAVPEYCMESQSARMHDLSPCNSTESLMNRRAAHRFHLHPPLFAALHHVQIGARTCHRQHCRLWAAPLLTV